MTVAEFQPPEGLLREVALKMCSTELATQADVTHGFHGSNKPCQWCLFDAQRALAALFEACEVRTEMRFVHRETGRIKRVLRYPGDGLGSDWLIEVRHVYCTPWASTGEEKTDG